MENSPLRFLDNDVSQILADQVRLSQEEEARKFHSYNFENSHEIDLNQDNHYLISNMFEKIGYLLNFPESPVPSTGYLNMPYFMQGRQDLLLCITPGCVRSYVNFKICYEMETMNPVGRMNIIKL